MDFVALGGAAVIRIVQLIEKRKHLREPCVMHQLLTLEILMMKRDRSKKIADVAVVMALADIVGLSWDVWQDEIWEAFDRSNLYRDS